MKIYKGLGPGQEQNKQNEQKELAPSQLEILNKSIKKSNVIGIRTNKNLRTLTLAVLFLTLILGYDTILTIIARMPDAWETFKLILSAHK